MNARHTYPDVVKGLNVESFGVYNCDQIYRIPNKVELLANYIDERGEIIEDGYVLSMIDLKYNGAYSFAPNRFECSKTGEVVLMLFTKSKEIYIIDNKAFLEMEIKDSGKYTFQMKNMTKEIKTSKDLAKYLNL